MVVILLLYVTTNKFKILTIVVVNYLRASPKGIRRRTTLEFRDLPERASHQNDMSGRLRYGLVFLYN